LKELGLAVVVVPAEADEGVEAGETPVRYLQRVVRNKLSAVARRVAGSAHAGILVADTTVVLDDEILGKPADEQEAEQMVSRLVGRTHVVYTRFAISRAPDLDRPVVERTVETLVTMRSATAEEARGYAATREGLDKAGGYAVQGIGSFLVERIEGSYSNVVGLPACEVIVGLRDAGLLSSFP